VATTEKYWNAHRKKVDELAKEFNGVAFTKAPFDIIDDKRKFYEVKVVNPRSGRHSAECPIAVSENEVLFGEIFGDSLFYVVFFKGNKYVIPFNDVKLRLRNIKPNKSTLHGTIRTKFLLSLSKKFLSKFLKT